MQRGFRGNTLLVELTIVLLFFSLSAVIALRLFAGAHQMGRESAAVNQALIAAQDWAECLAVNDDPEAFLKEQGWTETEDGLMLMGEHQYRLMAILSREEAGTGLLKRGLLWAEWNGRVLFELPVARYVDKAGAQ